MSDKRRPKKKKKKRSVEDEALNYEINTGFLDPFRGNISTPVGPAYKRGEGQPVSKVPMVLQYDMPYYARKKIAMEFNSMEEKAILEAQPLLCRFVDDGKGYDDYGMAITKLEYPEEWGKEEREAIKAGLEVLIIRCQDELREEQDEWGLEELTQLMNGAKNVIKKITEPTRQVDFKGFNPVLNSRRSDTEDKGCPECGGQIDIIEDADGVIHGWECPECGSGEHDRRANRRTKMAGEGFELYYSEIKGWDWESIKNEAISNPHQYEDGYIGSYYLGSVMSLAPSGKYYMPWTTNQTDEDVEKDQAFFEALDKVAEENGMFIESGEGDPTDVFVSINVDEYRGFSDKAEASSVASRRTAGDNRSFVVTESGEYIVYHKSGAGCPECHEDKGGPWYFHPSDWDGDVYSFGYLTKEDAITAAEEDGARCAFEDGLEEMEREEMERGYTYEEGLEASRRTAGDYEFLKSTLPKHDVEFYLHEDESTDPVVCQGCGWEGFDGELEIGTDGIPECPKCEDYRIMWTDRTTGLPDGERGAFRTSANSPVSPDNPFQVDEYYGPPLKRAMNNLEWLLNDVNKNAISRGNIVKDLGRIIEELIELRALVVNETRQLR